MQGLSQDIRYAFRQLRRSPGFAFTAVLTLAMAIAANVVVFGVLHALVLHPLPVPQADRVVQIQRVNSTAMSYPDYRDVRDRNRTFSGVAVFRLARIGLNIDGNVQPVWAYEATGNYFDMLGVKPLLGRLLRPSDDVEKAPAQNVVLSYACWQTRFGGDSTVIGKTVRLNKHLYTVVGVAPRDFGGTERFIWPELWLPMQNEEQIEGYNWLDSRGSNGSWDIGRLKDGMTPAQANADLSNIAAQLAMEYPSTDKGLALRITQPGFLGDAMGGPVHAFLYGVMGMALLVLLASCANLGGLFAARTTDRARELGIRIAIGSSRRRILRQLLTESVLLAVLGGGAAAFTASMLLHALTAWHPQIGIPVQVAVEPDSSVMLFSIALALVTGILFGVLPARQVWKTDPNQVLRSAGTASTISRKLSMRELLLALQIAICCLLVTASFVSLRGLQRTFTMPLGFRPDGVSLTLMDMHLAGYSDAQTVAIQQRMPMR